jgi:hypothetical protein
LKSGLRLTRRKASIAAFSRIVVRADGRVAQVKQRFLRRIVLMHLLPALLVVELIFLHPSIGSCG